LSLNLIESTRQIIQIAEDVSKKKFQFIEKADLTYYARVKPARRNMPFHLVFYKTEHNDVINHLIAHECGHIIRIFSVSEDKRLAPKMDNDLKRRALTEIESDINKLSSLIPFNQLAQIVNLWYNGTITQVTNQPPDIMIEKWIYENYPELRPYQTKSIKKQHDESIMGLTKRVADMTPHKIFIVSNVMNYCFFKLLGQYLNSDYLKPYREFKYKEKSEELVKITLGYEDNFIGDVEMSNKWANFLNISNWFAWTDFENIPANYLETF
jgi:hypothetical protein